MAVATGNVEYAERAESVDDENINCKNVSGGNVSDGSVGGENRCRDRWRVCLHEAAHIVAGVVLLKSQSCAMVFGDGGTASDRDGEIYVGGVANWGGGGDGGDVGDDGVPKSDEKAIAVMVGGVAEWLTLKHPPPVAPELCLSESGRPESCVSVRYPETVSEIAANITKKACLPDAVAIARWCIAGYEWNSFSWKRRHDWLYDRADAFVKEHTAKIIEVATRLFVRGIVTVSVELTILSFE